MRLEINSEQKRFVGYAICFLGFAIIVLSYYPGLMSGDTVASLSEGRTGIYRDQNSPIFSLLLGTLDSIVPGPGLMLVLQAFVFWAACGLFWHVTHRQSFGLGLALVLFGFAPQILSQLPLLWKDVAMAIPIFAATALIFFAAKTGSGIALAGSAVFLFFGYAARLNAFPAVLPIAVWSGIVACSIFELPVSKFASVAIGFGYFLVLSVGVYLVTFHMLNVHAAYPFQQICLYDLAAISVARNEAVFPDYVTRNENFSLDKVKKRYNPITVGDLEYPDYPNKGDVPVLNLTEDPQEVSVLQAKWLAAILENPVEYLSHRSRIFLQLIGVGRSVTGPFREQGFAWNPPEYQRPENFGSKILLSYFKIFQRPFMQTFAFRLLPWLALSTCFLYLSIRRRFKGDWQLVCVLSVSSLLFTLAYFPTAPATDFRYVFWPAIASTVAVIFGIYLLRKERAERMGKSLT